MLVFVSAKGKVGRVESLVTGIPLEKKGVSVREEVATGLGECFRGGEDAVQRGLLCNWAREC